jgi:hypothetical protein
MLPSPLGCAWRAGGAISAGFHAVRTLCSAGYADQILHPTFVLKSTFTVSGTAVRFPIFWIGPFSFMVRIRNLNLPF